MFLRYAADFFSLFPPLLDSLAAMMLRHAADVNSYAADVSLSGVIDHAVSLPQRTYERCCERACALQRARCVFLLKT